MVALTPRASRGTLMSMPDLLISREPSQRHRRELLDPSEVSTVFAPEMRNSAVAQLPLEQIDELCRRSGVQTLWLFGSALENLSAANDIDLLVEYEPHMQVSLLDRLDLQDEFSELLGRPVDLVRRDTLENPFLRHQILSTCVKVYAA